MKRNNWYPGTDTPVTNPLYIGHCKTCNNTNWYLLPTKQCAKCGGAIKCKPVSRVES